MDLVDNISKNIDEGNFSIGIVLDLSKASDTIDHTILLDKLCRYGIRGVTLNWFKHYLNDRKQFVSYNNTNSVSMKVTPSRIHIRTTAVHFVHKTISQTYQIYSK